MEIETKPIYRRVILKLSGEILQGTEGFGIDISVLNRIVIEVRELVKIGVQLGIVMGGGNLFRGSGLVKNGINRIIGDYIGMLSTIINGLAVYSALHHVSVCSSVMSAIPLIEFCSNYSWVTAVNLLSKNQVVIFVAGTGNPLFTTDSAACLRGIEISADAVLKATKVDGVFSTDPVYNPNAILYDQLSYQDILEKKINVMDLTAFILARDHNLPIHVFNINKKGALKRVIMGCKEGTLISNK